MTLPGKIVLCELEEDNPQKSYFRVLPLFTCENGALVDARGSRELLPDEGGIRIVPDKNEAVRFKSRMRTLGGYCILDLTGHPGENDKIRPNKNYSPERGENNKNIVYSDVIRACGDMDVMQVFGSAESGKGSVALTQKVILRDKGQLKGPYVPELTPDRVIFGFAADVYNEPIEVKERSLHKVNRAGSESEIYVSDALVTYMAERISSAENALDNIGFAPANQESISESLEEGDKAAPEIARTEAHAKANIVVSPQSASPLNEAKPAEAELPNKNESANDDGSISVAVSNGADDSICDKPSSDCDEDTAAEINAPAPKEKPQSVRERSDMREDRHPPRRDLLEGQLGLNPRRSKSLSEVVDYFWRQSRIERLGAEVAGDVSSHPVTSPVEAAKNALREAWRLPEAREALVKELSQMGALPKKLTQEADCGLKTASDDELNSLEAERLEILRDIDKLKGDKARQMDELMQKTREAHLKEIEQLESKEQKLRDECQSRKRAAEGARLAQAEAEKLLTRETKAKLDSEFLRYAMFTKAASLLKNEETLDTDEFSGVPETFEPTGAQMISDLRNAFEAGGHELSNDEALNLLACVAIGGVVILSGPTGCGKSYTAHALAGALGLRQKGASRFARLGAGGDDVKKSYCFRELLAADDGLTQRFMLLEDVNMKNADDQSRGLIAFSDEAKQNGITILMTCLDDQIGYPLQPRLIDRAFMIRLKMPEYKVWQPAKSIPKASKAPTLETVRKVFLSGGDIPGEVVKRMDALVKRLSEIQIAITPRALNDMYLYCSAVCPLMTGDKLSALDRAIAQRALPHILATAKPEALGRLPDILCDMPISLSLLNEPLALPPV